MWCTGLVPPRYVGSSRTRARTRVPCIGRRFLTTAPPGKSLASCFFMLLFPLVHSQATLNGFHPVPSFFFFFGCATQRVGCGILVPRPGIEPGPSALRTQSPSCWTTRNFLIQFFMIFALCLQFSSPEYLQSWCLQVPTHMLFFSVRPS